MATKFGYVERNLENDVNWAEVGKGFSDLLLAERDERKAKKKNLDDVMYSAQESFRKEAPIGYNTTFNDQTMSLVSQSTAIVKAWNTDMKAGNISPEEYMRKMQSMNDSVDTFFALGNNYNKFYENKLNRMDKGISGNVEGASFQAITDLLDFNKMGITFDVDGHIIAAPLVKGEDGVTSMDTDNARSIQAVFNLAQNDVDTIDVLSTIQDKVKLMGTDIVGTDVAATYGKEGMKKVLTGLKLTDPDTYNEYKATALNSMLVNDFHVAAILSDFTDKYETTTDRKKWEANKDKYLLVDIEDGKEVIMGEFTEKQREDARDILDKAWEGQVGTSSVETATQIIRPDATQRAEWKAGNATKEMKKNAITMLGYLYAGKNQADIDSALNYFEGLNENISKISRTPDKIVLTIRDPETGNKVTSTIPMRSDGSVVAFDMFVKGATQLTQKEDVSSALKYIDKKNLNIKNGKYVFNTDVSAFKERTYDSAPTVNEGFDKRVNRLFLEVSDVNEIQQILQTSGIESLNEDGKIIVGKEFEFTADGTEVVKQPGVSYDLTSEKDKSKLKQFIKNKIKTKEQRETFYSTPGDAELN
tara:strand:- start:3364 stop:5127 length:1764 start_codon:yes stop_codon:yes gene_type:complete